MALDFMAERGIELILTSGGLGPTADDLTAAVVGAFQGLEMVLDEALSERIAQIVAPLMKRWPNIDPEAIAEANRKQATIPQGAIVLEPVGTAPGLVVVPSRSVHAGAGPTVVVLPGPPRELQPMWAQALATEALQSVLANATVYRQHTLRLFGIPESEIAETLRIAEREGVALSSLEVTTCLKRGEVEVVTRYEPDAQDAYDAFVEVVEQRHADTLFSDGWQHCRSAGRGAAESGHDARIARSARSPPPSRAPAACWRDASPSCPGSSDYFLGGLVVYADEAKASLAGVLRELIERRMGRSRRRSRARSPTARVSAWARTSASGHRRGGPRRRQRGEARRARVAERHARRLRAADTLGQPPRWQSRRARPCDDDRAAPGAARVDRLRRVQRLPSTARRRAAEVALASPGAMSRGATARLFVAVDPPAAGARGTASSGRAAWRWRRARRAARAARCGCWTRGSLHLTLCFLGSRPVAEIEALASRAAAVARAPLRAFAGRAPVAAAAAPARARGEIHDLMGALAAGPARGSARSLRDVSTWQPERRRFWPHITVARVRGGARSRRAGSERSAREERPRFLRRRGSASRRRRSCSTAPGSHARAPAMRRSRAASRDSRPLSAAAAQSSLSQPTLELSPPALSHAFSPRDRAAAELLLRIRRRSS